MKKYADKIAKAVEFLWGAFILVVVGAVWFTWMMKPDTPTEVIVYILEDGEWSLKKPIDTPPIVHTEAGGGNTIKTREELDAAGITLTPRLPSGWTRDALIDTTGSEWVTVKRADGSVVTGNPDEWHDFPACN